MDEVESDVAEYHRLAVEWGAGTLGDPKGQNALFDRLHSVQKRLAASEEGQAGIASFMDDPDPNVRLSSASHSLRWSEDKARGVLEALQDQPGGMVGFNARYVLIEHDKGRLTFDF